MRRNGGGRGAGDCRQKKDRGKDREKPRLSRCFVRFRNRRHFRAMAASGERLLTQIGDGREPQRGLSQKGYCLSPSRHGTGPDCGAARIDGGRGVKPLAHAGSRSVPRTALAADVTHAYLFSRRVMRTAPGDEARRG